MSPKASTSSNHASWTNMKRSSMSVSSSRWTPRKTSRPSRTTCAGSWESRSKITNHGGVPMVDAQYFGDGLTYLNPSDLKGKLIAIEGTDGVGRSTHIEMLQEWLEVQGYGVITTGWTRSNLMSKTIEMAKEGNTIDRWSLSLLYATDFADRLEHEVIPALRSGFIVLADRYIY